MKRLTYLQTPDAIWKPYAFDRVTVAFNGQPQFSIIGPCFSEYPSGPNLSELADASAEISPLPSFGLHSCRSLGFRPTL